MTTTKSWDKLNRLTSIASIGGASSARPISSAYTYNQANQRTRNTQSDGSHWVYQYDNLGQVLSGKRYWSDGTSVEGQQFEYGFDDIGNRRSAKMGGDANGANLRTATYTPNNLNQYASRIVPGYVDAIGVADVRSTVTVNGQSTYRKSEYYRKELAVSNGSTNVCQAITNTAIFGSTNETVTGHIYVPQRSARKRKDFIGSGSFLRKGNGVNEGRTRRRLCGRRGRAFAPQSPP